MPYCSVTEPSARLEEERVTLVLIVFSYISATLIWENHHLKLERFLWRNISRLAWWAGWYFSNAERIKAGDFNNAVFEISGKGNFENRQVRSVIKGGRGITERVPGQSEHTDKPYLKQQTNQQTKHCLRVKI